MSYRRPMVGIAVLFLSALFAVPSHSADIIWVHQMRGGGDGTDGPGTGEGSLTWEDDQWRALIEGRGHNIIAHEPYDDLEALSLDDFDSQMAEFEAADLVIFTRDSSSGDYNDPIEHEAWTSVFTTPLIVMTPYVLRGNRWDMVQATGIEDAANAIQAVQPDHPIFEGVELAEDNTVEMWSQLGPEDHIDLLNTTDFGFGEVIAVEAETEIPWIVYWDETMENGDFYEGSFTFAGGPRLYLSAGSDDDPNTWGEKNITEAGDQIVLNAITFLTGDPGVVMDPNDCNGDGMVTIADLDCSNSAGTTTELLAELGLLAGDLDGEDGVAFADFLILSANFGQPRGKYTEGDLDNSGDVAFSDFLVLSANFGKTAGATAAAVPEPSGLGLIGCGSLLLGLVRRRK